MRDLRMLLFKLTNPQQIASIRRDLGRRRAAVVIRSYRAIYFAYLREIEAEGSAHLRRQLAAQGNMEKIVALDWKFRWFMWKLRLSGGFYFLTGHRPADLMETYERLRELVKSPAIHAA
jgi:hypothetical protein